MAATLDDNDRHVAELAKLKAETELIEAQNRKTRAETDAKLQLEIAKMVAETTKLSAETNKLSRETFWFPVQVFAGALGGALAVFAAAAGFLKFLDWLKP
jgi:hypothetical protein